MSCKYCEKIWEFGNDFNNYIESQDETVSFLLKSNGVVGLCLHFVDDENPFITGNNLYVTNVDFCPKCGRRLMEE